jgi:phage terminase large subunit-like protein
MSYIKRATEYAERIVSREIPACKFTVAACQRQLNDLAKAKSSAFPWEFNHKEAEKICKFIEKMPHIKGEWAKSGESLALQPWQCFILTTVFGWQDGYALRRFRKVYIEVPRKNGKTTFSAPLGLYMLTEDGEQGAEIYSAATTRDQAKIVFKDAWNMAKKEHGFRKKYGVSVFTHNITRVSTASKFESLSAEANSLDGLNIHCAIEDELHAHKTRQVHDVIETSMGSRSQPLLWMITTAGSNQTGICYEQRDYVIKILNGTIVDDSYFGIIYTLDEGDDWKNESAWRKANPNYGVSLYPEDIKSLCDKAIKSSQSQNAFKTKRLNIWVNANTAFMNMEAWNSCIDTELDINDFTTEDCFIGLDLSSKIDVTSKVYIFKRDDTYYIFSEHYLPEDYVHAEAHAKTAHYEGWSLDGYLQLTGGNMVDFDYIEQGLKDDLSKYNIVSIGYDPWQAAQMVGHLMDISAPMVEIRPNPQNFSDPMKMVEALVLSGKIRHDGNPVLTWMVSNVISHMDAKDNIYPRKERPENKIDGFVALLTALNRALASEASAYSVYEERGLIEID